MATLKTTDRSTNLARGLKSARTRAGLDAKEAAKLLNGSGITCRRETILAWERTDGETSREPSPSDLAINAAVFGCSVGELFIGPEPAIEYVVSEFVAESDSRR